MHMCVLKFVHTYSQICRLLTMRNVIILVFPAEIKSRNPRQLPYRLVRFQAMLCRLESYVLRIFINCIKSTRCQQRYRGLETFSVYLDSRLHCRIRRYISAIFVLEMSCLIHCRWISPGLMSGILQNQMWCLFVNTEK